MKLLWLLIYFGYIVPQLSSFLRQEMWEESVFLFLSQLSPFFIIERMEAAAQKKEIDQLIANLDKK